MLLYFPSRCHDETSAGMPLPLLCFPSPPFYKSLRCTRAPKGGRAGIWPPLTLNKLSECVVALGEGHPLGNHPGDRKDGWRAGGGGDEIGEVWTGGMECEAHDRGITL